MQSTISSFKNAEYWVGQNSSRHAQLVFYYDIDFLKDVDTGFKCKVF